MHTVAVGTAVEAASFVPNCIVHTAAVSAAAVSAAVVNTDPGVDSQAVVVVPAVVPQIFYRQGIAATNTKAILLKR